MQWLALLLVTAITVAAAVYTQIRLPRLAASANQAWIARIVLALVGVGFGWAALATNARGASAAMQALMFVAAFGLVHVPAAIILLLKTWQRKSPPLR
jgi:hypothetical protein